MTDVEKKRTIVGLGSACMIFVLLIAGCADKYGQDVLTSTVRLLIP